MISRSNFIIIGSTGRNTGKTEFACQLIGQYARDHQVYGVKVVTIDPNEGNCPRGGKGCGICTSLKGDYEITDEKIVDPTKDTSRMLMAGAFKVYFLRVSVHALEKGLKALLKLIPDHALTVCESNSIRKVIEPGLFLVIKNLNERKVKQSCAEVVHLADKVIDFHDMNWNFHPDRILIKNQAWILREQATAVILAGGRSSRMGTDKSMLDVNGQPLIAHIAHQLDGHFDEIIIGANDPSKYAFLNYPVIADVEKDQGPLMGIYSCLMASASEVNFITACDIPEMNLKLIHNMINISGDADIVMPVSENDHYEPLYAVYRKSVIPEAKLVLEGDGRRITELLGRVRVKFISFSDTAWYQNLNLVDDYHVYIKKGNLDKCFRQKDVTE
ncbi:MAG TPA: molybdenum cofactor guanylyltransferase [Bacteroidales bacterium]|nr:molybdenum cofactor guanylyltransferase [Bacteroidales bacterium]HNS46299.1 molybdenum cofactor guanylyltransferase [Bacteroidales bacterium]